MKYKNRLGMFDSYRGFAILSIVIMDVVTMYGFYDDSLIFQLLWLTIGISGTAGLMVASGYWFKRKPIKQHMKETAVSALKLYAVCGVLALILGFIIHWIFYRDVSVGYRKMTSLFTGLILGVCEPGQMGPVPIREIGALWYVWTYFVDAILLNILLNIKFFEKNKRILEGLIGIGVVVGLFCATLEFMPFGIPQVLVGLGAFYSGYRVKETGFLIRKWSSKDCFTLFLWFVPLAGLLVAFWIKIGGVTADRAAFLLMVPLGILFLRSFLWLDKKKFFLNTVFYKAGRYCLLIYGIYCVEYLSVVWPDVVYLDFMPQKEGLNVLIILFVRLLLYLGAIGLILFLKKRVLLKRIAKRGNPE